MNLPFHASLAPSCAPCRRSARLALRPAALGGLLALLLSAHAADPAAAPPGRRETLELRSAAPNQAAVPQFGKLELTLDLRASYDNPFDPEDIDVHAVFTAPDGRTVRVNAFLDQPFARRLEGTSEQITATGEPAWRIRFTPGVAGRWRYRVEAKDRSGAVALPEAGFEASPSAAPGFIRICPTNPRVFAYDNGKPFFAVGENVCWGGSRGSFDFDDWLAALGKAGGNWIRIWMCSWNCALEWARDGQGDWRSGGYAGVGFYSLRNAWKLDAILDAAERHGLSVMLCFGTYGEFTDGGFFNEGQWKANPYNTANGGPCAQPADFWTHPQARKLYRRRLGYLMARYAWRTSIQSWEFWNEAKAPAAWVAEMARCLKGTGEFAEHRADPFGHLVSTTYGDPAVWHIPEIDFTQTHSYGTGNIPDHAVETAKDARAHASFGKPHLLAEFGIDWRSPDQKYDPDGKGVNLHNGLWASAFSGNAGGAMLWWWDNYVHPAGLYGQFKALRNFVDTVPWTIGPWEPLPAEAAGLNLYGLKSGRHALLWAQNRAHHWKNVHEKNPIPPTGPADVPLRGLPQGRYTIEWWDTAKGELTKRDTGASADGTLLLHLPAVETDLALHILPE